MGEEAQRTTIGRELGRIVEEVRRSPARAHALRPRALRLLDAFSSEPRGPDEGREVLGLCDALAALYPESSRVASAIGSCVRATGHVREACGFFQRALALDPSDAAAQDLFDDAKHSLVARWHFRMLNDSKRNSAYRRAIEEVVAPDDVVLDLGCGCGLLSYYAAKAGARRVVACDEDPVMFDVAKAAFEAAGLPNATVLNESSFGLGADLGATALVAEIFDAGLLGEGAEKALDDARRRLTAPNSAPKTIPRAAKLYVCGVGSDVLAKKCRFVRSESNRILAHVDFGNLNLHRKRADHYDTEDLSLVEDVEYATDVAELIGVDFEADSPPPDSERRGSVELRVSKAGRIDAYAVWFDLALTENVSLTTDPRHPERCTAWDCALFYPRTARDCPVVGERFSLSFVRHPDRIEILDTVEDSLDHVPVSDGMLKYLNDVDYIKAIDAAAGAACVHLTQATRFEQVRVSDFSPFPALGLLTLIRGARKLTCNAESVSIIEKLSKFNDIDLKKVVDRSRANESDCEMFIYHCLDPCGRIDNDRAEYQRAMRIVKLKTDGIAVPHRLRMVARLVRSEHLDRCNRVYRENLCADEDFRPVERLNMYQVSQNSFPASDKFDKVFLSNEVTLVSQCLFAFSSETVTVPVTKDGLVNAIQCYYKIQLIPNALEISTDRIDSHIDNVYHLLDPPVPVTKGCPINILFCSDIDSSSVKVVLDSDE